MNKNILTKVADWLFDISCKYGYFIEYHDDIYDEENNYHLDVNTGAMVAAIELHKLTASK